MEENGKTIDKKSLILSEAVRLFYENGYDNTSIRTLAEATSLSTAGIYYFFQDKEEILFSILKRHSEELVASISSTIDQETDPEVSLRLMIRRLLVHSIQHNKELVILNRELSRIGKDRQEVIRQARRRAYDLVKSEFHKFCLLGRMREEDLVLASFTLFSETTWFARWYKEGGKKGIDYFSERIADMFLKGLIAPEATTLES